MNRVALLQGNQQWDSHSPSVAPCKDQAERDSFVSCAPTEADDSTVGSILEDHHHHHHEEEKKCVHFDEEVVECIIEKIPFNPADVWYSQSHLNSLRIDAEQKAMLAKKKNSTIRDLTKAFSSCPPQKKQDALNTWARKDYRGLEELANPQYAIERGEVQYMLWAAILEAQGLNATPKELCEISEQFSRTARDFARLMGNADVDAASSAPRRSLLKGKSFIKRNWSFGKPRPSSSS